MNGVLLVLVAAPELEETLVDWLLGRNEISGFTGQRVEGRSRDHGAFSLVEQVTGRQDRIMYYVQTEESTARGLIEALASDLRNCNLRYWMIPLIEAGRLGC